MPGAWKAVADAMAGVINGMVSSGGGVDARLYARAKAVSFAACFSAVVILRDPILLYACMVTMLVVFFKEWWFLILACAVPMIYKISATFNVLSGDMVSHVVSASSALNTGLNMLFAGVALIAAWPSVKSLASMDIGGAIRGSGRFLPIALVLAAKVIIEASAGERLAEGLIQLIKFAKSALDSLIPGAVFLTGFVSDLGF